MVNEYMGDQNQTSFFYESGTLANPSGAAQWMGEVQSCEVDTELNIESVRYQGSTTRNVDAQQETIKDYTVSINKYPQDWKSLYFALGSVSSTSGTAYSHQIDELNNDDSNGVTTDCLLPSITIENVKSVGTAGSNYVKTCNGCVLNEMTINSDGEGIISVDETWLAAKTTPGSGAPSSVTPSTLKRYKACQFEWQLPSGTTVNEMKGWSLSINNNLEPKHYSNGSCIATGFKAGNRDYEFSPTIDSNKTWSRTLYETYFAGGSTFNSQLVGKAVDGTQEVYIAMSGCKLVDMAEPTGNEGVDEDTLTVVPQSVSVLAKDTNEQYKLF